MPARQPILSLDEYKHQHTQAEETLRSYLVSAWGDGKLTKEELSRLEHRRASSNFAMNMRSRIMLAEVTARHLTDYIRQKGIRHVWFVDLVSDAYIFPLREAHDVDLKALKRWVDDQLPGCDYFGGIDAAYYLNGSVITAKREPAVSWHAHLMVWDVSEATMMKLQNRTNAKFRAGWEGASAFFSREWSAPTAVGRAMYTIKAPLSEYIAYPVKGDAIDIETGEVLDHLFVQEKRIMRRNHAVDMVKLYGSRSLDEMVLRSGAGKKLYGRIRVESLFSLAFQDLGRRHQKIASLGIDPKVFHFPRGNA
ncbi:hypothetical protein [Rhizobium leguminosarum]|uniref:hypothetical protein n=1 Tax=Rhizobium leguminosarum TaxID=384 RepID=UPI00143F31E9|nr:hypothetical protein [Rhizobium leguminosarum]NKL21570.1 hypothetical protein [Rhizobium leguminosarum bv. viciae]